MMWVCLFFPLTHVEALVFSKDDSFPFHFYTQVKNHRLLERSDVLLVEWWLFMLRNTVHEAHLGYFIVTWGWLRPESAEGRWGLYPNSFILAESQIKLGRYVCPAKLGRYVLFPAWLSVLFNGYTAMKAGIAVLGMHMHRQWHYEFHTEISSVLVVLIEIFFREWWYLYPGRANSSTDSSRDFAQNWWC